MCGEEVNPFGVCKVPEDTICHISADKKTGVAFTVCADPATPEGRVIYFFDSHKSINYQNEPGVCNQMENVKTTRTPGLCNR